jgi:hypothetical protein
MQYLNRMELRRLFQVAYQHNRLHHLLCVLDFGTDCGYQS